MIEFTTGRRRVVDDGARSTAQAAEALGVSRRRVQTLIQQGRLDGFRPEGGRDWRITRESVERHRQERDEHMAKLRSKAQDDDSPDKE